jgi:hypothetical protein
MERFYNKKMKIYCKQLLLVLVAASIALSSVNAQAIKPPTEEEPESPNCLNPLLNRFRNSEDPQIKKIALNASVGGEHKICTHEWNNHKSCCDAEKLTKYA